MRLNGFVGPSYQSQSILADGERCVNYYVEVMESRGAKAPAVLYPTPGFQTFATASDTPGRGIFAQNTRCFAVIGRTLYEVMSDGSLTNRGSVTADGNPATLVTNGLGGNQLLVTSGGQRYVLNLTTNVLTTVTSPTLTAAMGAMLDGYLLALDTTTSKFWASNLLDGLTWSGTQVAQRSAAPDPWRAMLVPHPRREIWLFGEQSSDVWYNAGTSPFPFAPFPGASLEYGIAAPFSAVHLGNPIWLGQNRDGDRVVVEAQGYAPFRISTNAVEYVISRYSRVSDAVAFGYQDQGHEFYVLNFPTANATWVYDKTTRFWAERDTWDTTIAKSLAYRPQYHAYVFGKHLVLDRDSGVIYAMDISYGTDIGGGSIRRLRRAPGLTNEHRVIRYPSLQLYLETGLGLVTGQGSDPTAMLRMSDDGGKTFGNEHWTSAGKIGQYSARVRWNRLGASPDRVFEVVMTDPIPWRIMEAWIGERAA